MEYFKINVGYFSGFAFKFFTCLISLNKRPLHPLLLPSS